MSTPLPSPFRAGLTTDLGPVPLEHIDVRADIKGAYARVTCTQTFRNGESRPVEATYVFPLDEGAAVCGFAATVGGVRCEGSVKTREEAFAEYDDALAEGHGGFLLDEEQPDVFTASVGNLLPGSEARIELTYVTELTLEGDSLRFMLPTTVAPRYAPAADRVGMGRPVADALNSPRAGDVPFRLSFTATITTSGRTGRIESPSHPIAIDIQDDCAVVTFGQENAALDRDVVLLMAAPGIGQPHVLLERSPKGRISAAITLRPSFPAERVPVDIVFLVDRSASMLGSSIEQVRNALQICLRSLPEGCRFDIVGFGSTYVSLFGECREYTERTLAKASEHVAALEASLGGTEILPALDFVLDRMDNSQRPLRLMVLTDGAVTNADAVIDLVRHHAGRVRALTFGIGRGASHYLVKGLARAGGGAAEFVYPGERIEPKVVRQFRRALAPMLTDVRLDTGQLKAALVLSDLPPVFDGEPLRTYVWVDELSVGTVTLRANGPQGPLSWSIDIDPTQLIDGNTIGTLAARARIRELEEAGSARGECGSRQVDRTMGRAASEVVRLALEFGLASRETSWVAIEKRETPVIGEVVLRRVPIAITSGWSGHKEGRAPSGIFKLADLASPAPPAMLSADRPMHATMGFRKPERLFSRLQRKTRKPDAPVVAVAPASDRPLDLIVRLQHADGSWDLDEALAKVLGVSWRDLVRRLVGATGNQSEIRRAWATALALAFLEREAGNSRDEWSLLAIKGRAWLDSAVEVPPGGGSWIDRAMNELASALPAGSVPATARPSSGSSRP